MTGWDSQQQAVLAQSPSGKAIETAELIRHVAIVGIAGVSLGLIVGGIGGRVLMRIAAVVAPDRVTGALTESEAVIGDITVGGTIGLLIFSGIIFGGIGAVAYVISERWLSWTGLLRPLAFAALILVVGSPSALDSDNSDFLLVQNQELVVSMFVALFLLYGIPMPMLVGILERRLPQVDAARPMNSVAVYLSIVGFGVLYVLIFVVSVLSDDNLAGFVFLVMAMGTLLYWKIEYSGMERESWKLISRVVGYGGLIGAAIAGTVQTWNAISDILAGHIN